MGRRAGCKLRGLRWLPLYLRGGLATWVVMQQQGPRPLIRPTRCATLFIAIAFLFSNWFVPVLSSVERPVRHTVVENVKEARGEAVLQSVPARLASDSAAMASTPASAAEANATERKSTETLTRGTSWEKETPIATTEPRALHPVALVAHESEEPEVHSNRGALGRSAPDEAAVRSAVAGLTVPPGFEVTVVADDRLAHDIFSLTLDTAGHAVVSGPGFIRRLHDDDGDGRADRFTPFTERPTSGAKGMVFDGHDLIYTGDNGLWRWRDQDGDGRADGEPERWAELRNPEHGANGVVQGPDGWFYVICGNDTGVTAQHATTDRSPVRRPQSGTVLRFAPDGRGSEIVAHGFRNAYDLDFHPLGHLFTVDSDGERDQHLPWYSPTRLFDVAQGQHHGWVLSGYQRSWNRPAWFPDTVPRLLEIGRGSPTGLTVYRHEQFPLRYRGAIFSCCWTLGRVYCFPLQPDGTSYQSEVELFLQTTGTTGFAPVDLAVDPHGDLLVAIGGRGTQGGLFRIRYRGEEAAGKELPAAAAFDRPSRSPTAARAEPSRVAVPANAGSEPVANTDGEPIATALDRVLRAPQPLSAWSRARWRPLAMELGAAPLLDAIQAEERELAERIRAVEVLTECFEGIPAARWPQLLTAHPHLVQRVAWSISRRPPANGAAELLAKLTFHDDPLVQRAAWEGLAVLEPKLPEGLTADWSDLGPGRERRIRLAAWSADARSERFLPRTESTVTQLWRQATREVLPENALRLAADALLAAQARQNQLSGRAAKAGTAGAAAVGSSGSAANVTPAKVANAAQTRTDSSPKPAPGPDTKAAPSPSTKLPSQPVDRPAALAADERLDAVRLMQLALGDVLSQSAQPEAMAGYDATDLQRVPLVLRTQVAKDLAPLFPTGELILDRELARLLGMLVTEDRGLIERLSQQLAAEASLLDQLHGLMVLSRLPGPRDTVGRERVVDTLLRLDQQMASESRLVSRNWPLRVAEMYTALQKQDPLLAAAVAVDKRLVRPGQAWLVPLLPTAEREHAARMLLRAILAAEDETLWTEELLPVVGVLPLAEAAPIARQLWEEPRLRDQAVELLARLPEPVDRQRFLTALGSVQLTTVKRSAEALSQLAPAELPVPSARNQAAEKSGPATSTGQTTSSDSAARSRSAPAPDAASEWTAILVALRQACSASGRESAEQVAARDSLERLLVRWTGEPRAGGNIAVRTGNGPSSRSQTPASPGTPSRPPASSTPTTPAPATRVPFQPATPPAPSPASSPPTRSAAADPAAQQVTAQQVYAYWLAWWRRVAPEQAAKLAAFAQADEIDWPARLAQLDWTAGSAQRGKGVFERYACARCHAGQGRLGPDLAGAANRLSREDLFVAILDPSREVSPLYRLTQVVTASGRTFTGILVYESPEGTLIQTAADQVERIAGEEIVAMRKVSQSLMPNGPLNRCTDQELADQYAFLRSL